MLERIWDAQRQLYLHWQDYACDVVSPHTCIVENEQGEKHQILKHHTRTVVQVSNGPFTVGREWYTVNQDTQEYKTFDAALQAAFKKEKK